MTGPPRARAGPEPLRTCALRALTELAGRRPTARGETPTPAEINGRSEE